MRKKSAARVLPPDITFEIFLRLPLKTLARFRSVSSFWYYLISHPPFQRQYDAIVDNNAILLVKRGSDGDNSVNFTFYMDTSEGLEFMKSCTKFMIDRFRILPSIQSCHDLVLLGSNYDKVCICNLSSENLLILPGTSPSSCVGLGYAPLSKVYKVVQFSIPFCEVLTIGTTVWRRTLGTPYLMKAGIAPFIHGALHLIPDSLSNANFIAVFNVEEEKFGEIMLPDFYSTDDEGQLVVLGGSLCLFINFDLHLEIWLLKDYKNVGWMKEYSINFWTFSDDPVIQQSLCLYPLAILNNGNILMNVRGRKEEVMELICYDYHGKNVKLPMEENCSATSYQEKIFFLEKKDPSPHEAMTRLVDRISSFYTHEFLSSSHPLLGHFRVAMKRFDNLCGRIPLSAIVACDVEVNNLCKVLNPKAESDPLLMLSILLKAVRMSSICTTDGEFWIKKNRPFSPETLRSLTSRSSVITECNTIEAIHIPCSIEENVEELTLKISDSMYYMDEMAKKLNARDSSRVFVSRTPGKDSSEMNLFFVAPDTPLLSADSCVNHLVNMEGNSETEMALNKRASCISGQNIFGNAILANVGYTAKFPELSFEDVNLSTYYRMLLAKVPDGHYKLSRGSVLVAQLPTAYTRLYWRGPLPSNLLSVFCRLHRLSQPIFSVKCLNSSETSSEKAESSKKMVVSNTNKEAEKSNISTGKGHLTRSSNFSCELKLLSKRQDPLVEFTFDTTHKKEEDAIQNAALKVLVWLNDYYKQLDLPVKNLCSFIFPGTIKVFPDSLSWHFPRWSSIHIVDDSCSLESTCIDQLNIRQGNGSFFFNIRGPDCGVFPSPGSLTCISYAVSLVRRGESLKENLESNDEFEFEIGTGAVMSQLETCVAQMSTNQSAQFTIELFPRELILAATSKSTQRLQQLSLHDCFLEYSLKVLKVTEPLEDRMEQALFNPPLSKQRYESVMGCINECHSTTLVDFGCGSGSLLEHLMQHITTLDIIVGVDISLMSLARAAKVLQSKLSTKPVMESGIKSAVLYNGSVTDFDSRLHGFDVGTCLEVIEHMEEDEASKFGDTVLSLFCPRVLIVSTPNYEYNYLLERAALHDEEDSDPEESPVPCELDSDEDSDPEDRSVPCKLDSDEDSDPEDRSVPCKLDSDPEERSVPCELDSDEEDSDSEESFLPCEFRNIDHKFEWTRQQFELWATKLAKKHNYSVEFSGVGGSGSVEPGFASQIAIFKTTLGEAELKCLNEEKPSHCYRAVWEWSISED